MTIRDIAVAFGYEVDEKSVSHAENTIKNIKGMATKLLGAIGIGFSIAGMASLAEAAADAEALKSQFSQTFGDMESEATNRLDRISDDTGIMVNRMKGSFSQITAFAKTTGMETSDALELADRAMVAVADSAAYYDRSLEDVTNSLQSFLKGNFANDAALGLSCTETTRNIAANELYGKSFKDLSEAEKQLTLLQMVEDANKASGALGQAARESDTWTNQLGNLKQSLQDLKAAAGAGFLQPAVKVLKLLSSLAQSATRGIQKITGENGIMTRSFNSLFALVKKLKPSIDRMMQTMSSGIKNGIERLGGIENALKLAGIVAGAFVIALNWSKIIDGARKFIDLLKSMARMFSAGNLKLLGLVAIIVLLALIVEDFINFMKGNDSVIGYCFEKAGIDADEMREKIKNIWENLKTFFAGIWNAIKTAAAPILEAIKKMIEGIFGEDLFAGLGKGVAGIIEFLERITDALAKNKGLQDFLGKEVVAIVAVITAIKIAIPIIQGVIALIGVVKGMIAGVGAVIGFLTSPVGLVIAAIVALIAIGILLYKNWDKIKAFAISVWTAICDFFKGIWEGIKGAFSSALEFIKNLWETVWGAISTFFSTIWNGIVAFFTAIWNAIVTVVQTYLTIVSTVWNTVWGAISSFFQGIWNGIVSFVTGIWDTITGIISGAITGAYNIIVSILTAIQSFFSSIFSSIASFVTDTFNNILSGITSTVGRIKDAIVNGLNAAINWIKSLPSQALQWGADIVSGIADGINGAIGKVSDAVSNVAEKIKGYLHFSVPDEGPLTEYESWMPDFMSGLAEGIGDSEDTLLDRVKGVASGISTLMKGATANTATAVNGAVNNTSNNTNITQNNTFNNSYSGGEVQTQQNVSKGMNKSARDATDYLAKGLAYAR